MKILHLIDPASPGGGACTLKMLAEPLRRLRSIEHDVVVIGSRRHADLAESCGVQVRGLISPPLNRPILGRSALARTIGMLELNEGAYDIIHAWTLASGLLATWAAPHRKRVASLAVGPVSGLDLQLLKRLLSQYELPLLASSSAVEREYRSMGLGETPLSILPPAVNPESAEREDRAALRRRWEVDDDAFVIGLLSEPVNWADARVAIDVVSRVAVTGRKVRLLLHHSAPRRIEAERWARKLNFDNLLIVEDDVAEPWRVTPGLDAALLIGGELNSQDLSEAGSPFSIFIGGGRRVRPMPGVMPLLWSLSDGVPVIAEASDAVRDVIVDGQSGLLVEHGDVNAAADRIVKLYDDSTIAGRIGRSAKALASERFHISAYCVRLREVYDRIMAGRPAQVVSEENTSLIEERDDASLEWKQHAAQS